jgi:hypothetical protein
MRELSVPSDGQTIAMAIGDYEVRRGGTRPSRILRDQYAELVDMPQCETPTVWIVDDDLGFLWWLGELFHEARCQTIPALSCDDALSLMKKVKVGADLIIVNPHLPGVSAMLDTLRWANRNLKIVTLRDPSEPDTEQAKITLERPSGRDRLSRAAWLKKIRKLLKQIEVTAPRRK